MRTTSVQPNPLHGTRRWLATWGQSPILSMFIAAVVGMTCGLAPADDLVRVTGEGEETQVILENDHLRMTIRPYEHPGIIDSLVYKADGRETSAREFFRKGEGPATQRTNYGYLWRESTDYAYQVIENTAERAVVEVTYRWRGEADDVDTDFGIGARYTLARNETRVRVDWSVINHHADTRSLGPWLKHTMQPLGRDYVMLDSGPAQISADRFFPRITNWMARVEEDPEAQGHTFFTTVEAEEVIDFYYWRGLTRYTHEFIFKPLTLAPGETWSTTYFFALTPNLPNVAFAAPEGAVSVTPTRIDAPGAVDLDIRIAPAVPLGEVRLEGELMKGEESILPLGPRYVDWSPGRVVDAHYSFSLPSEGVYMIRLNAYRDGGEQHPLGKEVGAYAQVIEVPLVVGTLNEGTSAYAVWPQSDAGFPAIEGKDLDLPVVAAGESFTVATTHPADRIFREDRLATDTPQLDAIELHAAGGEWESIPLYVFATPGQPTADIEVALSPLRHESSDATIEDSRIFTISHLTTSQPSRLRPYPVGRYPDPLLPVKEAVSLSSDENLGLWVNVQVPLGAKPGLYTGAIELRSNSQTLQVPVRLRVWDFDLPSPSALRTWAGFVGFNPATSLAHLGIEDHDVQAFRDAAIQWCLDYGFSPGHGARYTLDELIRWNGYNRGISAFFGGGRGVQQWATPENIHAQGWDGRVYQYAPFDEHGDDRVPEVADWIRQFRQDHPYIKVLDVYYGTNTTPLHDLVDVWCRQMEQTDWVSQRLDAGDEFWFVNGHLIWGVEYDILPGRQQYWQMWSHGYTGQLLWSVISWGRRTPPDFRGLGVNGIALALYPTPEGPTTTIRWENMRDGLEDYDYLAVLRSSVEAAEKADDVDETLLQQARAILDDPNLHERVADYESLQTWRLRVGQLIEAIGRPW